MGAPPDAPRTLGDLLAARPVFVGRAAELAALRSWRAAQGHPVLALLGPGGVGKSALVGEWLRLETHVAEVHDLRAGELLPAPSPGLGDPVRLVVVDEWDMDQETLEAARAVLERQELPVKVLLVGRDDPRRWWPEITDHLQVVELGPLTLAERCEYLERRGVSSADTRLRAAFLLGGHPHSLTLAQDPAHTPPDDYRTSAAHLRRLGVASARLLESVPKPLQRAVVAACLARIVDRPLLEAMVPADGSVYDELARLPLMHAVVGGLAVAPVARRAIAEYAAWRDPVTIERMRAAGLRELADRFDSAPPGVVRTMAAVDLHFLVRDRTEAVSLAAEEDGYGLRPGRMSPADLRARGPEELDRLVGHVTEDERAHLWDVLDLPGAWVTTAVDAEGGVRAIGGAAPLSREGLRRLDPEHRLVLGAQALARHVGLGEVPTAAVTNLYVFTTGMIPLDDPQVSATMYAHMVELNLLGGAYLCFAGQRVMRVQVGKGLRLGSLQLHILDLPGSATEGVGVALAYDRSRLGVVEQVLCLGRGVPAADPTDAELEAELAQLARGTGEVEALARLLGVVEDDPVRRRELVGGHVLRVVEEDLRVPGTGHWLRRAVGATQTAVPTATYRVRVLGEAGAWSGDTRLPLGSGPLLAVTVLVAWHGRVTPERVLSALWPDVEVSAARVRLRTTLMRIRKVAPGLILRDQAVLRLGDGASVDAVDALRQCDLLTRGRGDAAALLDLVGGAVLPGLETAEWAAPVVDEVTVRLVATLGAIARDPSRPTSDRLAAARRLATYAGDDELTLGEVSAALRPHDPVLATELELRARAARSRLELPPPVRTAAVTPLSRAPRRVPS